MAERYRSSYAPGGRGWFSSESRYSNPDAMGGFTGKLHGFSNEVLKPAGWGALGLVGSRVVGEVYGRILSGATARMPAAVQPFAPLGLATLSSATTWLVASRVKKLSPQRRRYVNVGAGMLVVQELLALILPKLGFLPLWARRSLTGELPPALAGLPGVQALGNCFTGSCADALAPYGGQQDGCHGGQQYTAAAPGPMAGQPGYDALGNCFTGACPGNAPGCTGSGPQCCGCPPQYPPGGPGVVSVPPGAPPPPAPPGAPEGPAAPPPGAAVPPGTVAPPPGPGTPGYEGQATAAPAQAGWGMAGNTAVQRSGITDPVVQQILAGSCERAQKLMDQVGLAN